MKMTKSKMSREYTNYILTVAVEIGSFHSGYALAFKTEPDRILMNKNWTHSQRERQKYKTPTSLLVNSERQLVSFGYEAEEQYAERSDRSDIHLFRNILENVPDSRMPDLDLTAVATDGNRMPLKEILYMSLLFMKNDLMLRLNSQINSEIPGKHVCWVVIIPAFCSAKLMRTFEEAAVKAGLFHTEDKCLVGYPLARAIISYHGTGEIFQQNNMEMPLQREKGFLLLHSGERRVTISFASVQPGGLVIEEKTQVATGSFSHFLERFIEFMNNIFGSGVIESYFLVNSPDEMFKDVLSSFSDLGRYSVDLTFEFVQKCQEMANVSVQQAVERYHDIGVTFSNGRLVLSGRVIADLLDPVIDEWVTLIRPQLQLSGAKFVILTGSMSNVKYVVDTLEAKLSDSCRIFVPIDEDIFALKGAVMYGQIQSKKKQMMVQSNEQRLGTKLYASLLVVAIFAFIAVLFFWLKG